jgi:lysophospholipase L1-like esterase
MTNRREFFKAAALSGAALAIPQIVASAMPYTSAGSIALNKNDVILFQGDSITDAGRNRDEKQANIPWALGSGYSLLASAHILNKYADKNLTIYNRGIGGNKVYQLKERWQGDCLDLKPNVLSIHIGVNDYWHTLDFNYTATVDTYEQDYRALLKQTREALPNVKLIICEPFGVLGVKAVTEKWFPAFDAYRAVAKKLAGEFNAVFIPFHSIFTNAQKYAPGSYWTADGVHPTLAGASLMSEAWLQAIK